MWIVDDTKRSYHAKRLRIGTKGYWWRGGRIAYVTVIDVDGLKV